MKGQCEFLGVARSSVECEPVPDSPADLQAKALWDKIYMEDPCLGSRRLVTVPDRDHGLKTIAHPPSAPPYGVPGRQDFPSRMKWVSLVMNHLYSALLVVAVLGSALLGSLFVISALASVFWIETPEPAPVLA